MFETTTDLGPGAGRSGAQARGAGRTQSGRTGRNLTDYKNKYDKIYIPLHSRSFY